MNSTTDRFDTLMLGLSLGALREANIARAKQWNKDGVEIPLSFASTELAGECGEACNEVKKLERTRYGLVGGKEDTDALATELADVVICADLLAIKAGINLSAAVVRKFNETSDKHGFSVKLPTIPYIAARATDTP